MGERLFSFELTRVDRSHVVVRNYTSCRRRELLSAVGLDGKKRREKFEGE